MSWYPYRFGSIYAPSTGKPTLAWAQAVKRLELAGLAPGEPEADRILKEKKDEEATCDVVCDMAGRGN